MAEQLPGQKQINELCDRMDQAITIIKEYANPPVEEHVETLEGVWGQIKPMVKH